MTGVSSRPQGVTILAIISFAWGAFGILGGLAALGLGAFLALAAPVIGGGLGILGLVSLVLAAGSIVFGAGLWLLKPWAWPLGVALEALSALSSAIGILSSGIGGGLLSLVVSLAILWYLHQPHVRAAFGAPTAGFPLVGDRFDRYIPGGPKA